MDGAASVITIISATWDLAKTVKELVERVRQRYENARELEGRLETLTTILSEARELYARDRNGGQSYPREQILRQAVKQLVERCGDDLKKFEEDLKKLVDEGNWLELAWRQHTVGPQLTRIENSISSHHQRLSMLVELVQGEQLNRIEAMQSQVIEMLRILTNNTTGAPLVPSNDDQAADTTDSMVSRVAALIGEGQTDAMASDGDRESQGNQERNNNGISLLKAIEDGSHDDFESLLRDGTTSLNEKDTKERTPLLLAAHLDKGDMLSMLLVEDTNTNDQNSTSILVPWDEPANVTSASHSSGHGGYDEDTITNRREIDLTARDSDGRTALHYCAEFDLRDQAKFLLDHDVDVNAHDNGNFTPLYFAVRDRNFRATELLLSRGASTDFEWPEPTSAEITTLLEKHSNNG